VGLLLSEPSPRLVSDTGDFLLAALMMIDMNGLDIEAVEKMKELILESVNTWKNYKKRIPSMSSAGVARRSRSALGRTNVYSQLSGLEDMGFNDLTNNDSTRNDTPRQVLHPFLTL
jgi:hypothetical protein